MLSVKTDLRELAKFLGISFPKLTYIIYIKNRDEQYRTFTLQKKAGGQREIHAPLGILKALQRRLADLLQDVAVPIAFSHGFVRGKSVVSNAKRHVRRRHVLNVDLRDFFPSINFGRVRGVLISAPYSLAPDVATAIANILTFRNALPQGSPASPVMSNMICARLDSDLYRLCREKRCCYTRYADDITISTNLKAFPSAIAKRNLYGPTKIGRLLKHAITENGFRENGKKTRLQHKTERQVVTGLIVNSKINVDKTFLRRVRAMLHAWRKYGYAQAAIEHSGKYRVKQSISRDPEFHAIIRGMISYIFMVRGAADKLAVKFLSEFTTLNNARLGINVEEKSELTFSGKFSHIFERTWIVLGDNGIQGTAFNLSGVGIVTCAHCVTASVIHAFRMSEPQKRILVSIVKKDEKTDLAIVEFAGLASSSLPSFRRGGDVKMGDRVALAGFPNYCDGDSGYYRAGNVVSSRDHLGQRRIHVDIPVLFGSSGGPLLTLTDEVVGVAVSGVRFMSEADHEDEHGVIPISKINTLFKAEGGQ